MFTAKQSKTIQCCSSDFTEKLSDDVRSSDCFPVPIPSTDKYYGKTNIRCMNFIKAEQALSNECTLKPLLHVNNL